VIEKSFIFCHVRVSFLVVLIDELIDLVVPNEGVCSKKSFLRIFLFPNTFTIGVQSTENFANTAGSVAVNAPMSLESKTALYIATSA
jgi:hypothetical protein